MIQERMRGVWKCRWMIQKKKIPRAVPIIVATASTAIRMLSPHRARLAPRSPQAPGSNLVPRLVPRIGERLQTQDRQGAPRWWKSQQQKNKRKDSAIVEEERNSYQERRPTVVEESRRKGTEQRAHPPKEKSLEAMMNELEGKIWKTLAAREHSWKKGVWFS